LFYISSIIHIESMKIVLNAQNSNIISGFLKISKNIVEIIPANIEKMLFDSITAGDVNAFVIDNSTSYSQKSIDFIKKKHPYIPVVVIGKDVCKLNNADIYIEFEGEDYDLLFNLVMKNVGNYETNFAALQRLTSQIKGKIEFGMCMYDPNKRTLYHNTIEVCKLSVKSGGIVEMLGLNFGKAIKKEVILERVWRKNDYYSSRSMDVYVTGLRKILKENNINMKIKNISGVGLILE